MTNELQVEKRFVEAGDSPPTYFEVVFYPDCKVTARIDASSQAEAIARVQTSLSQWDERLQNNNGAELTSAPKWFEDVSVNVQVNPNSERLRKTMTACQVSSSEDLESISVLDVHPLTLVEVSHQPSRASVEKEGQNEL